MQRRCNDVRGEVLLTAVPSPHCSGDNLARSNPNISSFAHCPTHAATDIDRLEASARVGMTALAAHDSQSVHRSTTALTEISSSTSLLVPVYDTCYTTKSAYLDTNQVEVMNSTTASMMVEIMICLVSWSSTSLSSLGGISVVKQEGRSRRICES